MKYEVKKFENNQDKKQVANALNTIYSLDSIKDLAGVKQAFGTSLVMHESGELAKSYLLYLVKANDLTKGKYKNIESYAKEILGISKTACYNYIKVGKYINPKTANDNLPQPTFNATFTTPNGEVIDYQAQRPNFMYSEILSLVENLEENQIEQFCDNFYLEYHLKATDFKKLVKAIRKCFDQDEFYTVPTLDEISIKFILEENTKKSTDKGTDENTDKGTDENTDKGTNENSVDSLATIIDSLTDEEIIQLVKASTALSNLFDKQ